MVQATESWKGLNLALSPRADRCGPTCWRVLRESEMSPVLVVQADNLIPIVRSHERSIICGIRGVGRSGLDSRKSCKGWTRRIPVQSGTEPRSSTLRGTAMDVRIRCLWPGAECGEARGNCAALLDLKLLLHHARSTARNLVLQAQHSSSPGGGADAKIGKATEGYPTGIVSPTTSDSKLAKVTARNQTEDSGTTGATAARTSQENPGLPARKGERR